MLIGFVGSPQSGKTTTAAKLFASLKEVGLVSEFVCEQARFFIARRRLNLAPWEISHADGPTNIESVKVVLNDDDQFQIMKAQLEAELTMAAASPSSVVITDASVLNTLLYMSPAMQQDPQVQWMVDQCQKWTDLLFYCAPISSVEHADPNRVHSLKESLALDQSINQVILPRLKTPLITLTGDVNQRVTLAKSYVFQRMGLL